MNAPSSASIGIPTRRNKTSVSYAIRAMLSLVMALVLVLGSAPVPAFGVQLSTDTVDGVSLAKLGVVRQAMPDVGMQAGVLVDGDGRILWARNADDERAMASLTKIMTAVIAVENSALTDTVTVTSAATHVGESTSFLRTGDKLPMQELLEALLVKSGNDAAVAVALHVASSTDKFVALMNAKAADLGLTHTRFTNAHGLDGPGHHTSARDLSVLARYAMSKPAIHSIVGMKQVTIGTGKRRETLPSTNVLLGNYQGITGIKTGYTGDAGYCVIESADRNGLQLYAVVLGTKTESARFRDARELLDWGYAHYRQQSLVTSGTVLAEAPVRDYLDVTVPAVVSVDSTVAVLDLSGPIKRTVTVAAVDAPVKAGQHVGVVTFTQAGRLIASVPLVSSVDVRRPNPLLRVWIALVRAWRAVF